MMRILDEKIPLTHWRLYGIVTSPPASVTNPGGIDVAVSINDASPGDAHVAGPGMEFEQEFKSSSADPSLHSARAGASVDLNALPPASQGPAFPRFGAKSATDVSLSPAASKYLAPLERQPSSSDYVTSHGLKRGDRVLLDSRGGDKGVKEDWITTANTDVIFEIPVKHADVYYSGFEIELGEQNESRTIAIYHLEFFGRYVTTQQSQVEGLAERIFRQALQVTLASGDVAHTDIAALDNLRSTLGITMQHALLIQASLGLKSNYARSSGTLGGGPASHSLKETDLYVACMTMQCGYT